MNAALAAPALAPASLSVDGDFAVIDMGSNSFRLEIGGLDGKRYRRVDYLKETVRLGAGLDAEGVLGDEAATRGLDCLARFARRLDGFPGERIRAVATQTLREAKNRNDFLRRAEGVLGHEIEVISGREEARLIYAGVARLQPSEEPRLVIDIGGRSTEMILGRGLVPEHAESFAVGSVGLSMRYFPDGRFSERAFRAAQVAAGAELEEALLPFAPEHWREALGSSGTVGAVAQVLAANGISDGRITAKGLRWLSERCLAAGSADRLALAGLKDDRRAVIGGGLAILQTLATQFEIGELKPARGALRQGVIFDLVARREVERAGEAGTSSLPLEGLDLRDASVTDLQGRFDVDRAQAARVATLALALLASARSSASAEARRELRWAALLHETGQAISHHDHHRHSAYILAHVDAPGFSQSQLRRVGDLVLGQRGGLRKLGERLAEKGFALDLLCLRVAVIACHARADVEAGALQLGGGAQPVIELAPGWAEAHPRALHLLSEEMDAWARSGVLAPQVSRG